MIFLKILIKISVVLIIVTLPAAGKALLDLLS